MLTATSTDFGKLKSSKSKIACQNILAGDLSYLFNYKYVQHLQVQLLDYGY